MKNTLQQLLVKPLSILPPSRSIGINIFLAFLILPCFYKSINAQTNSAGPVSAITTTTHIGGYHIKCHGQNSGIISANPSFGKPPYTYLWSTGDTSRQINNKPAGIYYVTATDSNQFSQTDTFALLEPDSLYFQAELNDFNGYHLISHDDHDGFAGLNANGGTPPYKYLWSNSDTRPKRFDLSAGNYTFTITDANQCSVNGNVTLVAPDPVQFSFSNIQNTQCYKSEDGAVTLSISGGLGDFSVVWSNGSFSLSPDDLPAGYNEVRIFEQGNPIIDTGITINEPPQIEAAFTLSQYNNGNNVSCVDCFNGSITTSVSGGTAPYTYLWNDENQSTTANLSNLNGGDYTIIIVDAHACEISESVNLKMPTSKDWSRYGNSNIDTAEFIGSTDTSAVVFKTNNQEALRIRGNGNVGVGAVNPTEKLEVDGIIKAQGLKLNNLNFRFYPDSNAFPEKIIWGSRDDDPWSTWGTGGIPVLPSSCIDPINVYRYNIFKGAAVFKPKKYDQGCTSYDPAFYVGLLGCDGIIEIMQDGTAVNGQTNNFNKLLLNTLCGKDVLVGKNSSGNLIVNHNLGIGISQPNERLEVNGNSILNGNVRIGNASSTASNYSRKLVVEGIIYSREFRVTDNQNIWPDFVFNKSHKLISLSELKAFIEKEKHLPNIPSAQEVTSSGGFSVNEMIVKLLQKQEETTLYLLQLNEKIAKLEKENQSLKAAIK